METLGKAFFSIFINLYYKKYLKSEISFIMPSNKFSQTHSYPKESIIIKFKNYSSFLKILLNPRYYLGKTYVDKDWELESGDLAKLIGLLLVCADNYERNTLIGKISFKIRRLFFKFSQKYNIYASRKHVEFHYDLNDTLYKSFLDDQMNYSCADFSQNPKSLEAAQIAKLNNTIKRIHLKKGHKVLEIGCGWGALSRLMVKSGAEKVIALTLSHNQLAYAQKLAIQANLNKKILYLNRDYREYVHENKGKFDRVISIGMLEHVGLMQMENYFSILKHSLKPDGEALVHSIIRRKAGITNSWINRYIFPGGYIPKESEVIKIAQRNGLVLLPRTYRFKSSDYILTLRCWSKRLEQSWPILAKQGFDDKLYRQFQFYFAGSEAAFDKLGLHVTQFVLKRVA